jgi:hypothetical protein
MALLSAIATSCCTTATAILLVTLVPQRLSLPSNQTQTRTPRPRPMRPIPSPRKSISTKALTATEIVQNERKCDACISHPTHTPTVRRSSTTSNTKSQHNVVVLVAVVHTSRRALAWYAPLWQRDALWQLCGVRGGHARPVLYSSFSRTPHLLGRPSYCCSTCRSLPPPGRTSLALGLLRLSDEGLAVGGVCIAGYRKLSQQPREERDKRTA